MAKTALTEDMLMMAPGLPPALTCVTIWRRNGLATRKAPLAD